MGGWEEEDNMEIMTADGYFVAFEKNLKPGQAIKNSLILVCSSLCPPRVPISQRSFL